MAGASLVAIPMAIWQWIPPEWKNTILHWMTMGASLVLEWLSGLVYGHRDPPPSPRQAIPPST